MLEENVVLQSIVLLHRSQGVRGSVLIVEVVILSESFRTLPWSL
jgi:hypothetical protein